jgi:hypothetical protein
LYGSYPPQLSMYSQKEPASPALVECFECGYGANNFNLACALRSNIRADPKHVHRP